MLCPTPTKGRYATREAAESAANRAKVGVGHVMAPYLCRPSCGWWHLTSRNVQPIAPAQPDPEIVRLVTALGDEAFTDLVRRDIRRQAHPAESAALRQPEIAERWDATLAVIQVDLERQFAQRATERGEAAKDWRRRASYVRLTAAERRKEAKAAKQTAVMQRAAGGPRGDRNCRRDAHLATPTDGAS